MADIPSFKMKTVKFRGPTTSHDYNEAMQDIFYDVMNAYNKIQEHEREIEDAKETYRLESHFQNQRNHKLSVELEKLKRLYEEKIAGSDEHRLLVPVSKMERDMEVKPEERANLDKYHGIATLPIVGNEISKVFIYDDVYDEVIMSDKLDIDINIDSDATYIQQNDVRNMCNGDNASYWKAKCIYTPAQADIVPDQVEATITMHLPEDIISNRHANAIYIHPFPHNTLTIRKVEYRLEGGWRLLPGWEIDEAFNAPAPTYDAGNTKLVFPSMPIGEIRLTISQPYPVQEDSNTVFYLGMQEIGVVLTDYQSNKGHFQVPLRLREEGDQRPKVIKKVIPHFANHETLSDKSEEKRELFSYSVYTVEPDETLAYTKETLPILVNRDRIVIKGHVKRDRETKCSPSLEWLEVVYEDR